MKAAAAYKDTDVIMSLTAARSQRPAMTMSRRSLAAALAGLGLFGLPRSAEATGSSKTRNLAADLNDHLKPAGIAAMALVATSGGRVVETVLLGEASRAFHAPVRNDTLFQLGSVGKHVTAVAILRLAERGKLALDAPVSRYLSGIDDAWGRATIRQLLTHTGGLPGDFTGQALDRPFTRDIVSAFSHQLPPVAGPGRAWVYSNIGYVLLGFVIENLTGQTYGDHVTQQIFQAHGLVDSRSDDAEAVIVNRAEPLVWKDGAFQRATQMSSAVSAVAAGGLLMSARDVPAWERALSGRALLSDDSKAIMFAPARFDTGRSTGYGTGWRVETTADGRPFFMHTGSVPGFRAFHFRSPDRDRALMLLAVGEAKMASFGLEATERQWPDQTPLGAPAITDLAPELTAALRAIVTGGAAAKASALAPELARLPATVMEEQIDRLTPEQAGQIRSFTLVEDLSTALDRQRRYVVDLGERRVPLLAGYSPEGQLYRVSI